jgi:hypothetical protein
MECQDKSLLAKLGWQILTEQNLLWVTLRTDEFFNSLIPTPNAFWILKCRYVVKK